ncbi:MAG: hypothetical protein HOW73_43510 [Polyangiaceae bacterium]|nr:hypothetical protein [Polyangiaceae bacterium]
MIEFRFLIPVNDNDGAVFTPEHDTVFETFIAERFPGLSREPGLVVGAWRGKSGQLFHDQSRVYVVALDSVLDAGRLREVLQFARRHYRQEAIFLRYLGLAEEIRADPEGA